ncbi:MAG: TIGR00269 family protein [Thermoprotei archaeon]|nr:MAG: TIGR00269 family protein [Thermoprotei archaeon]
MVNCSLCNRPAVYVMRAGGKAYCEHHFLRYFDKKVRKTIRKYRMFREKEHIVVAVSGGKDSLALLHYLNKLSNRVPGWRISALLIDEGIKGYRDRTIKDFLKVVNELNVDYRIVSFKKEIGYTLDEIVKIGINKGLPYLPCSYCGVFRRYLLNKAAREMSGSVLATAHNLDDIIQTYLLNIIQNNWDKVPKLAPVSKGPFHPKFVRRVKPFYEVLEKETTLYAILNSLYPEFIECPYAVHSVRWSIRRYINELEEKHPGTKYSLIRSLLNIIGILEKLGYGKEGAIGTCSICGEPSSNKVCRACMFRKELGILT